MSHLSLFIRDRCYRLTLRLYLIELFLKVAQGGGQTWDLFGFSFIFSLKISALDHLATASP